MINLIEVFDYLGWGENEAVIYSDLIENGPSTLQEIAKRTKIPRTSLYDYYPNLVYSGLISETSKEGRKKIQAEDPELIKRKLENINRYNKKINQEFKDSFSRLSSLFDRVSGKPKVKLYSGEEGLKIVMKKILACERNDNLCLGTPNAEMSLDEECDLVKWFLKKLEKKKIKTREIVEDIKSNREYLKKFQSDNRKIKLYPRIMSEKSTHIDKFIFGNSVAVFDFTKKIAYLIEDKHFAENERIQFEIMWGVIG